VVAPQSRQSKSSSSLTHPCFFHSKQQHDENRLLRDFTWPPTPDPYPEHPVPPDGSPSILASDGNISSSDTVPAVMVAVASSLIICAVALYVSDLRDRCRHDPRFGQAQDHHHKIEGKPKGRGRNSSDAMDQLEYVEEISIAPVSTMTASLALDGHSCLGPTNTVEHNVTGRPPSLRRVDSDKYLAQSVDITELSDLDRVSGGTDLSSLVDLSRIHAIGSYAHSSINSQQHDASLDDSSQVDRDMRDSRGREREDSKRIDDTIYIMSDEEESGSGWTSLPSQSSEISIGTYLKSVHSRKSRSSSVGSNGNSSGSPKELFSVGEQCLKVEDGAGKAKEDDGSLERSPDTPHHKSHEVARKRNELSQLEHLYKDKSEEGLRPAKERKQTPLEALLERSRLPIQEYKERTESLEESSEIEDSLGQSYVRNIFYVPVCPSIGTSTSLGIEFESASCASSYPSVKSVHGESPLRGRLFEGDKILAVNNKETAGRRAKRTEEGTLDDVLKLTVLSRNPDGSDDSSSESDQESMDTGINSTAIEV
jgi:hypothetical protein